MTTAQIQQALMQIEEERDMNVKALLLAALVSEEFRSAGFEPVIVGGSAIEFYTDGAYMSGDTDICWKGVRIPTPVEKAAIAMKFPGAQGSIRSWRIAGLFIDLLNEIKTYAGKEYSVVETPLGNVVMQPVEDLIAERVFSACCWTGLNETDDACARKLMASCLNGEIDVDWSEVERISQLPDYLCLNEVRQMKGEILEALAREKRED